MRPRVVPESGELKSFRVALYARVSTVHGGQNPEMQLWEMREYCERRNWIITGEYVDRASGLRDSRPSLNLLFKDATQRKFDSVLVWKLDRFGRSLRHLVNCLAELQALGVKFVSLKDSLDLSTPAGTLMCHVLCCMSQFEASLARERVISGLAHARSRGKRLGRPTKCVDVDKINALRASGHSWRLIARTMKLSVGTVYAAARSQHAKVLCA